MGRALLLLLAAVAVFLGSGGLARTQGLSRRIRSWLEETHSVDFELRRHFFLRFFDSDLVSTPGQWRIVAGGVLGVLLSLSLIFVQAYYHKYLFLMTLDSPEPFRQAVTADALFLITLAMTIIALFATLQWPALFPGLRDYLALAGLPIRARQMFIAKFMALAALAFCFTLGITLAPSVMLPMVMAGRYAPDPGPEILALFLSTTLGALFVFFSLVAVQGVLLNLMPLRAFSRISLWLQGALLTILLCGLPLALYIPGFHEAIYKNPPWAIWIPPAWFLGLHEVMIGRRHALALQLAFLSIAGCLAAVALGVLTYLWSYHRHRRRVVETPSELAQSSGRNWPTTVVSWIVPDPVELGVFVFISKTLMRSRQHRLILTGFAALAAALLFNTFATIVLNQGWKYLGVPTPALIRAAISVPLAFSLFIMSGFRYLFRLPVEVRANWLFRLNEPGREAAFLAAVSRFLMWSAVAPVAILTFPLEIYLLGPKQGVPASLICLESSLILSEILLAQFEKIPFTSSYLPGRRPVIQTLLMYALAVAVYVSLWSGIISLVVRTRAVTAVLFVVLLAIWLWIRSGRLGYRVGGRLEFEELPERVVQTLSIQRD